MSEPILLDTDIGTDIDDAYALVLAVVSPEVDLRAVTVVNNDIETRARIARTLLRHLDRDDVPVALGARRSLTPGETRGWAGHEGQGLDLSGIDALRDFAAEDAMTVIAEAARTAHGEGRPLTIITIGALTNVARALDEYPDDMSKVGRIVAMTSTFVGWGEENAHGEHNVACDPVAMERVLASEIPITLIGLNVTCQTRMAATHVDALAEMGGPLASALVGMHRVWFGAIGRDHSPMHDPLAVAVVFRPSLVALRSVSARVRHDAPDSGVVVYEPPVSGAEGHCQIAVSVDAEAFHTLFFERLQDTLQTTGEAHE